MKCNGSNENVMMGLARLVGKQGFMYVGDRFEQQI